MPPRGNQRVRLTAAAAGAHAGRAMSLRFSILTPTLNRRALLGEALESVAAQRWPAVQHIVADGGSSDGTLEWLAGQGGVQVLEGPDAGIYDGLNKAAAAAEGDIVGWLNSDDSYAPSAFAAVAEAFARDTSLAAVCGAARIESGGRVERHYPGRDIADLSPGALLIGPTLPNAWFFRRDVFRAVGPFSAALRFAADSDFMMRFARLGAAHGHVDDLVYRYRRHDGSATIGAGASLALREDMLALALMWRKDAAAGAVARALEGRCRAALAVEALRRGKLGAAASHAAHLPAIFSGVSDWAHRRLDPALRLRREGEAA